eukprot:1106512-Pelagomonas_calceolata.AAC.1
MRQPQWYVRWQVPAELATQLEVDCGLQCLVKSLGIACDYAEKFLDPDSHEAVLLASGSLNPCLSRLERARSAVGRRRLLFWTSNSCMRWWKVGQN